MNGRKLIFSALPLIPLLFSSCATAPQEAAERISMAELLDEGNGILKNNSALLHHCMMLVKLPENPTGQEVESYLATLARLSALGREEYSYGNMLTAKLFQIGPEHRILLVPHLEQRAFAGAFLYLTGDDREALKNALAENRKCHSIIAYAWGVDATAKEAPLLLGLLRDHPALYPFAERLGLGREAVDAFAGAFRSRLRHMAYHDAIRMADSLCNAMGREAFARFADECSEDIPADQTGEFSVPLIILARQGGAKAFHRLAALETEQPKKLFTGVQQLISPYERDFAAWYLRNSGNIVFNPELKLWLAKDENIKPEWNLPWFGRNCGSGILFL